MMYCNLVVPSAPEMCPGFPYCWYIHETIDVLFKVYTKPYISAEIMTETSGYNFIMYETQFYFMFQLQLLINFKFLIKLYLHFRSNSE